MADHSADHLVVMMVDLLERSLVGPKADSMADYWAVHSAASTAVLMVDLMVGRTADLMAASMVDLTAAS